MESCCTQLHSDCAKLAVEQRQSSLSRSERPLCRAKSITHFVNRYAEAKFPKFRVWDKIPDGNTLIFGDTRICFYHSVGRVCHRRVKPHAHRQPNSGNPCIFLFGTDSWESADSGMRVSQIIAYYAFEIKDLIYDLS